MSPVGRAYRLQDLEGVAGTTYRQLDNWVSHGYIRSRDGSNPGSGVARTLTDLEYRIAERMCHLVSAGVPARVASRVAREMITDSTDVVSLSDHTSILWTD